MDGSTVAGIVIGGTDSTGAKILTVYAKVGVLFAVYGTAERVMVQFADDQAVGADQRMALAPLFALQGQINGLIDGWRGHGKEHIRAKAAMFDRRVADALKLGLLGAAAPADQNMREIKDDVLEERISPARVDYVLVAAAAALAAVLLAALLTSRPYGAWYDYSEQGDGIWLGFGAGALGALFSVCIALRKREVRTDLQPSENRIDAIARILIGALAGAVLASLLEARLVALTLGGISIPGTDSRTAWLGIAVAAFAAGFVERLVSDLLDRTAIGARPGSGGNALAGSGQSTAATAASCVASETNPLGRTTPNVAGQNSAPAPVAQRAAAADNAADSCLADPAVEKVGDTDDVERPPASGGVEERP